MELASAARERIKRGIVDVFTIKQYPLFLTFASNFLSFSYENIIMMYMQSPDAKYVAGIFAWKQIAEETIKLDEIPVLVLYPELIDGKFVYTIRKVFDYQQVGMDAGPTFQELSRRCETTLLYDFMTDYYKEATHKMPYIASDNSIKSVQANGKNIIIPKPEKTRFQFLLDYYMEDFKYETQMITGCIRNTARYLIYRYYNVESIDRIVFPYITLPAFTDSVREMIIKEATGIAATITREIDGRYFQKLNSKKSAK